MVRLARRCKLNTLNSIRFRSWICSGQLGGPELSRNVVRNIIGIIFSFLTVAYMTCVTNSKNVITLTANDSGSTLKLWSLALDSDKKKQFWKRARQRSCSGVWSESSALCSQPRGVVIKAHTDAVEPLVTLSCSLLIVSFQHRLDVTSQLFLVLLLLNQLPGSDEDAKFSLL